MSITSVVNDVASSVSVINAQKPLPPTISGYSVGGVDDTALDPAGGQTVQINGTGFLAGATITFDGSAVAVVTYVNPNQLTFTSPAKSAGTYTIYVVNSDGGTAIYIPGIIYSVLPTWTTSAGSLGSYYETTSISNTVVASGDAPITYSLFSGSLPTGSTLYANGVITGTAPVDSSSTTYSFTIQATDAQLQDSTRSFSLTINVDAVTWVSPANNTTYTSAVDSAIANVTLSATDAAGYAVSYSANALPTGLTLTGANISGTPTVIADSSTLLTATAATTNRSAVRTINWSITVANDPYFEYNTLLIPGASTTFVDDASTNNFAVTIMSDTKPNSFNPYTSGYYSNYFDGSGDYLSVPHNTLLDLWVGNFTIEMWVYSTGNQSNYTGLITKAGSGGPGWTGWQVVVVSNCVNVEVSGATLFFSNAITLPNNQWVHIAIVKSSTNVSLFQNGTRISAVTGSSTTYSNTADNTLLGTDRQAGTFLNGYISNVRTVKGTAVYDPTVTTLTVPTSPLTAIANTSLLTCQSNRFIDNSGNAFTVTVLGNTSVKSFDPFVPNNSYSTYGSGYFDGSGDYLKVNYATGSTVAGDFTWETWAYDTGATGYGTLLGWRSSGSPWYGFIVQRNNGANNLNAQINSSAPTITITQTSGTYLKNQWIHVALVRSGTTVTLYVNGTSAGTGTLSGSFNPGSAYWIGSDPYNEVAATYLQGYISNQRFVNGTAVYTTSFTPPTAPLTAIANTGLLTLQNNQSVNNSVFLDNSTNNFLVTRAGTTTQGTFSPYGGNWSNYFDGTGDYLAANTSSALNFTGAFTVECWFMLTQNLTTQNTGGGVYVGRLINSKGNGSFELSMISSSGSTNVASILNVTTYGGTGGPSAALSATGLTLSLNVWYHVAVVRNTSSVASLFLNGSRIATNTISGTYAANPVFIGGDTSTGYLGYFPGYISNMRAVNSSAVYDPTLTTLTVPTTPLTAIANTSLLTCQSPRFIDNSVNNSTITKNGDVSVQRFSPFNPSSVTPTSYSGYFDGSGDYLTFPATPSAFGTGNFTIEAWVYLSNFGVAQVIFDTRNSVPNNNGIQGYVGTDGSVGWVEESTDVVTTAASSIIVNAWHHIVWVRAGTSTNQCTIYVNGVSKGTGTSSLNHSGFTGYISRNAAAAQNYVTGYISNLRVVKGVAVYTGAFTVPTSPLAATQSSGTNIAAITGTSTSLLTLQSPTFIDNSTNNFTISAFGNSQPTQQNPFGFTSATTNGYTVSTIGGSGYFDGVNGSYLTIPANASCTLGTNNHTIECWYYATAAQATYGVLWAYASGSTNQATNSYYLTIGSGGCALLLGSGGGWGINIGFTSPSLNAWHHMAVVRNGNVFTVYIDGVSAATGTYAATIASQSSFPFEIGGQVTGSGTLGSTAIIGYITDVRFTNGTALYTSNFVPPSAPLTAIQNSLMLTNMTSAGIYDAAMMNNMQTVADATLSTAITKFGGSSMSFDGTGDQLTLPITPQTSLGPTFTIEAWIYLTNTTGSKAIYGYSVANTSLYGYFIFYVSGTNLGFYVRPSTGGSEVGLLAGTLSATTWTHVAVSVNSNSCRLYINGTQVGSTTTVAATTYTPVYSTVGADMVQSYPMNGYIDDLRITKGYARYTSNFSVPTTAFPIY